MKNNDFDSIKLKPEEVILWSASAVTFHRSVVAKMAVTTLGIYLNSFGRVNSSKWKFFFHKDIKLVTIANEKFFDLLSIFSGINPFKAMTVGKTKIVISTLQGREYEYETYPDCYEEERVNDRELVIEFTDELKKMGVKVVIES